MKLYEKSIIIINFYRLITLIYLYVNYYLFFFRLYHD